MGIKFDKKLVDAARKEFFKVYVDKQTSYSFIGSETAYTGDRIRIYESSWDYERAVVLKSNAALRSYLKRYISEVYEGIEFMAPVLD